MKEATKVEPALTPEEWGGPGAVPGKVSPGIGRVVKAGDSVGLELFKPKVQAKIPEALRHALAALCLHDHPFGFTWEDVDELRREAEWCRTKSHNLGVAENLEDLADRIAALLPPREGG